MTATTIFAPATARGRAGVAVIRVSGPAAGAALVALTGSQPPARRARRARLTHPQSGDALDDGLVLWFPGPGSFTGEDVAEFQTHGGTAVIAAMLEALSRVPDLRPAEPGEFSRRAFLNGRMDLTEAEAIADLVNAETEVQRRQALRQADGALARLYDGWRDRCKRLLAHLEAVIDFPDEDLPPEVDAAVREGIATLSTEIAAHLDDRHRGERLRDGVHVAVVGVPNAGKSSLVNRLARREAAIVSAMAGTTRDVVEVHMDLGGYPLVVADTAGLRETDDLVEAEGVRRARARMESADLTLHVIDGTTVGQGPDGLDGPTGPGVIRVYTKIDLIAVDALDQVRREGAFPLSTVTGEGLGDLEAALEDRARILLDGDGGPALTRQRHRTALEEARSALDQSLIAPLPELAAEDLRMAMRAIGRVTGRVDVDELLDVIFRDFCIGK
ncbi:tRNA uridine-5-carboxymethylaminomethyl(34) synthesis GTPase MnmE [Rhodospirillum sp. A1_3_36]|uniref:tRNA uridine-5-carboxymethylaminomethyl(34) synthesis GTPase MnmE n=1 Tax=Rhodospirillum sp. A1_3_36 TaxID=3391666 RepID=UPI0039A754AF